MISIVTPTYNSECYLESCIKSICEQKADIEHIVIDGGSTDKTISILQKYEQVYNLRWISEKDNGMYDALSKGFALAQGDILCWLNSDDRYMPWTTLIVEKVFQNPRVQWCQGIPSYINSDGLQYMMRDNRFTAERHYILKGLHDGQRLGCLQQESMFWRRALYEKSGGLNTSLKYAGDFHLWTSFAKHADLFSVNAVLACFRIHKDQKSANRIAYVKEIGQISPLQHILKKAGYYRLMRWFEAFQGYKNRIDVRFFGSGEL